MIEAGPDEKIYPVAKIAVVFDALADEGVPTEEALARVRLSKAAMSSPAVRVSLNQILERRRTPAIVISPTAPDCAFMSPPTACTASPSSAA